MNFKPDDHEILTRCWCYRIERIDGVILGFTSHDQPLTIDGLVYRASASFSPTGLTSNFEGAVNYSQLASYFDDDAITELDIRGGKYHNAKIKVFLADYRNLEASPVVKLEGVLGEISSSDRVFTAEARSLSQYLQQKSVKVTTPTCPYIFGGNECGFDLTSLTDTYAITSIVNRQQFAVTSVRAEDFFANGKITFTSGNNNGFSAEVKSFSSGTFILWSPMPYDIHLGDTIMAIAGCAKTLEACKSYGNIIRFGGDPFVAGDDAYLKGVLDLV